MIYLLDVNVLIAFLHQESVFHERVHGWATSLSRERDQLAFCAISELGAVRILPQLPGSTYSVVDAKHLLIRLKSALRPACKFLSDELDAQQLPQWVSTSRQTTDGHLLALAKAHGAKLATFDRKIPGAFVIPA